MKHTIILMLTIALSACSESKKSENPLNVRFDGALKNIMHKGDLSAKADLREYNDTEHLYGLGAVENLKGEILILDGTPFISSVKDDSLHIDNSFEHKATLFVYAQVDKWKSIEIPRSVLSYADLETYIKKAASMNGIDVEEPFPLMIEGRFGSFDWHVIDWKDGDTEHSHEKHINSGLNGTMKNENATVFGFYSNSHHAIYTHHTTNMHLHVKTSDNQLAGHVDDLILGENMVLRLPASSDINSND